MKKWTVVLLAWTCQIVIHMIRVAMGIAAATLIKQYGISVSAMGWILSGWNLSYTAFMLPIGPVVDRWGSWIVMGSGSVAWSISTLLLPLAGSAVALFAMRFVFGACHSMFIPAQASAVSRWFPPERRATATGLIFSGGMVGLAIGSTVCAFLLTRFGWQAMFYCLGGFSLLFSLCWFVFYPERRIGTVSSTGIQAAAGAPRGMSLMELLRYRSAWGLAFGQMGYLYAYFFFVTWLPGYLIMERGMSIMKTGWVASLPFWLGMLGTIGGGLVGDFCLRRGYSLTVCRKGIIGTGMSLATIAVISAAFTSQTWLAVALMSLCLWSMRMTTGSANALPVDLAPPYSAASLASIQNFGGNIGGLLAPIVTGYLVQMSGSFVIALVVAGIMVLLGGVSYCFLVGKVETIR
jgi:MFS family permease